MLTLNQARSHSTKGFTQLLPPGPCSTSSPYRPVNIHLPLHLLLEAFLDSPLNCTFCKKHLHGGLFSIISHTVSSPASAHELLRVCSCIPQIPRTGLDHLCKHRRGPPDPPAPDTTHRWPGCQSHQPLSQILYSLGPPGLWCDAKRQCTEHSL